MKVKKVLLTLLAFGAVSCATVGFSACGKTEKSQNEWMSEQTAYALAAEYGYTGTEEEFAVKASLKVNAQNNVYIQKVELSDDGALIITYTDGRVESLGYVKCVHAYSEWELALEPTCSSIGYNTRVCAKCNDIDYDFLQPLGHTAIEFTQVNQSSHTYYCTECGAHVHELHDLQDGECTVCDYVLDYTLGLRYQFVEATQSYKITGTLADSPAREAKEIIIPSTYNDYPVTEIEHSAFNNMTELYSSWEKVVIPEGVTTIGRSAFMWATIKEVIIPDSIEKIEHTAFAKCTKLQSVRLPSKLKTLGYGAFSYCQAMTSVILSEGLETIEHRAFIGCSNLKDIQLPSTLKQTGESVFYYCTSLESIIIPEGLTEIQGYMFYGCTSLASVTLHDKITGIGYDAFGKCAFTQIDIPASVELIGSSAFSQTALERIELPEGLTDIASGLFSGCKSLTEVVLPESIEEIKMFAFQNCTSLTHIDLPSNLKSIGQYVFRGSGLTEITISGIIEKISDYAFADCKSLTTVIISEGIQQVGAGLFKGCTALETLVLPESVTSISAGALVGCDGLTTIEYSGTKAQWKAIEKASGWRAEDNIITDLFVECSDGTLEYIW